MKGDLFSLFLIGLFMFPPNSCIYISNKFTFNLLSLIKNTMIDYYNFGIIF